MGVRLRAIAGTFAAGLLLLAGVLLVVEVADLTGGLTGLRPLAIWAHLLGGVVALAAAAFAELHSGLRSRLAAAGSLLVVATTLSAVWFT